MTANIIKIWKTFQRRDFNFIFNELSESVIGFVSFLVSQAVKKMLVSDKMASLVTEAA